MAAEDRTDLTEEQWSHAGRFTYSNLPDLSAVLRSEAVVVVPQDLALALAKLEAIAVELGSATERSEEARRDVLPAWHERRVPLSEGDASRIRHFRTLRAQLHELVPEALEAFSDAVAAIDRWR